MTNSRPLKNSSQAVAIIGGGPAGLMAAEVIAQAGFPVSVFDAMPSLGRKFLLAGVGGMNITHAEDFSRFLTRYAAASAHLQPILRNFAADALRDWIHSLGIDTFVGTSNRVFPKDMKAAPLLRAWLHRLRELGVRVYTRHEWLGWAPGGELQFLNKQPAVPEMVTLPFAAAVLALGGASWPRLGSNGAWVPVLQKAGVAVADLEPSNCGFAINWSDFVRTRCAGEPLNTIALSLTDHAQQNYYQRGECIISATGIEGSAIYAISGPLRETIRQQGAAQLRVDLLPDLSAEKISRALQRPRGKDSLNNFLRKQLKLPPIKIHLLREVASAENWESPAQLATLIKSLPLTLHATQPIAEAISSAGGVTFAALDQALMLKTLPGIFCAGEMLDWEAPTGGYLLTACFATGRRAGEGVIDWLKK